MTTQPKPRYPTSSARKSLAARFGLPYDDHDQDWEWQIADARRFREFLFVYQSEPLDADERLSLMEILIQCVDDMGSGDAFDAAWRQIEPLLLRDAALLCATITYWSGQDIDDSDTGDAQFNVTAHMRRVLNRVQAAVKPT